MLVATMCLQNSQRLQADPATPVLHEYTYESACADLLTEWRPCPSLLRNGCLRRLLRDRPRPPRRPARRRRCRL